MATRVKFSHPSPAPDTLIRNLVSQGIRVMLEEIDKESKPRTPRKIGDLRNRTIKVVQGMKGSIHWKVPYAARQENTQFRNYTTPGTGPHFAENAVRSVVARAASIFGRMKV